MCDFLIKGKNLQCAKLVVLYINNLGSGCNSLGPVTKLVFDSEGESNGVQSCKFTYNRDVSNYRNPCSMPCAMPVYINIRRSDLEICDIIY